MLFAGLLLATAMAVLAALVSGSADIGVADSLAALRGGATEQVRTLVLDLR
jgi:hypothetical protein